MIGQDLCLAHYQILSIILLSEFIKLNVNRNMVIKNAKHAESNTNIPSPVLNMQVLKMYSIQIKFGHFGHFLYFLHFFYQTWLDRAVLWFYTLRSLFPKILPWYSKYSWNLVILAIFCFLQFLTKCDYTVLLYDFSNNQNQ